MSYKCPGIISWKSDLANKRGRLIEKVIIITTFFILCGAILTPATVLAETANREYQDSLTDCLIPKDSMYYEGHTYLAFDGAYTWYEANSLCETMGGHLVSLDTYEEQAAITKLSTLGWTDACAFSEGNTREWIWHHSGEVIGIMHEPQGGNEGDQFYYTPNSDNVWDASTNEPNSWKAPWDQNVAELNERGLNSLMPSDTGGFICEFDSLMVFSVVDLNYDLNYQFETDWGRTKAWVEYPASYTDGLPEGVDLTYGKPIITPEYTDNRSFLYSFMGYSLSSNGNDLWQNSEDTLHMDNSKWYIGETELKKPVITLYAVWEEASTTQVINFSPEDRTITPSENQLPTEVPDVPAELSAMSQKEPKADNTVISVIRSTALIIAVVSIGGFSLFIGTNIGDLKEVIHLLQDNPPLTDAAYDDLISSTHKKVVDKKKTSRLKYPFLYIKLREYTYIIGQKDTDGSGRLLHKVKLKFKSQSKLSLDLTEDMQNTVYKFYRIRHPKKAMRRKKDISIVYLNKEEILEQDHFSSMSDFVNIKIIEN